MRSSSVFAFSAARRSSAASASGTWPVVLVEQLVLEACPRIHRGGPELHLYVHVPDAVGLEHRDTERRVQAAIAVGLRGRDVVVDLADLDVRMRGQQVEHRVEVGHEAAHDAHARDVAHPPFDLGELQLAVDPTRLVDDARRRLQPGQDVFDRIVVVELVELLAEDLQLRRHLVEREPVRKREAGELPRPGLHLRHERIGSSVARLHGCRHLTPPPLLFPATPVHGTGGRG